MAKKKTDSEIKAICNSLGLVGRSGVKQLAASAGTTYRAASGWVYEGRVPRYPAVEQVKAHLITLATSQRRADLISRIQNLYRRAS